MSAMNDASVVTLAVNQQGLDMTAAPMQSNFLAETDPGGVGGTTHRADKAEAAKTVDSEAKGVRLSFGDIPLSLFDDLARESQLRQIEAVKDLLVRAELIAKYRIQGTCERSRKLIKSVDGVSITGCAVQAYLNGPTPSKPVLLASLVRHVHRQLEAAYPAPRRRRSRLGAVAHPLVIASMKLAEQP